MLREEKISPNSMKGVVHELRKGLAIGKTKIVLYWIKEATQFLCLRSFLAHEHVAEEENGNLILAVLIRGQQWKTLENLESREMNKGNVQLQLGIIRISESKTWSMGLSFLIGSRSDVFRRLILIGASKYVWMQQLLGSTSKQLSRVKWAFNSA